MKLEDYYFDYEQGKINKEDVNCKRWYERGAIKSQAIILMLNPTLSKKTSIYIGLLTGYLAFMAIANEVMQNAVLLKVSTLILCILFTPVFLLMLITTICSIYYIFCFVWGGEEVAKKTLREIFSSENSLSLKDELKVVGKLSLNKEKISSKNKVQSNSKKVENGSILEVLQFAKQEAKRIQNERNKSKE